MTKTRIALLGGDNRELILLESLMKNSDYEVFCYGQPAELLPSGLLPSESLAATLKNADILILPLAGVSQYGMVFNVFGQLLKLDADDLSLMSEKAAVISGMASKYLKDICKSTGKTLITTVETDAIAVPNSIPTAEAAISLAIKNSAETINGSKSLIIGYGRVGQALACRMRALGSDTEITNRGEALCQKAQQDGFTLIAWNRFDKALGEYDYIFNTVPALVLPAKALRNIRKNTLVMDLASSPGGVDFDAARDMGLNAMQALGLPGKFSPVSAGKILAAVYPHIIDDFISKGAAQHG